MSRRQITIKDIARALNISTSTVSRALRDRHDVNPKTREAVLRMAQEYDYQPNKFALQLKTQHSRTLGVIIPSFQIPFYSFAISGIQEFASEHGYNIITCQSNESCLKEIENLRTLIASKVDGLLLSISKKTYKHNHLHEIYERNVPMVMFNRIVKELNFSRVCVDDYQGAYRIVNYLIQCGHKDIAHIAGPLNLKLSRDRNKGYLDALYDATLKNSPEYMREGDFTPESGYKITRELINLPNTPDAIFCTCDAMAFGSINCLKNHGFRIPQDIAVVGFTDEPFSELVDPKLTTISQPAYDIGRNAADLLIKELQTGKIPTEPITKKMSTKLVIRSSA
jgi:DNA-binding LacI/PurR family transcriptional regulator